MIILHYKLLGNTEIATKWRPPPFHSIVPQLSIIPSSLAPIQFGGGWNLGFCSHVRILWPVCWHKLHRFCCVFSFSSNPFNLLLDSPLLFLLCWFVAFCLGAPLVAIRIGSRTMVEALSQFWLAWSTELRLLGTSMWDICFFDMMPCRYSLSFLYTSGLFDATWNASAPKTVCWLYRERCSSDQTNKSLLRVEGRLPIASFDNRRRTQHFGISESFRCFKTWSICTQGCPERSIFLQLHLMLASELARS